MTDENVDDGIHDFESFCRSYRDWIFQTLVVFGVPEADAEDIAQQILLKLWDTDYLGNKRPTLKAGGRPYLYRVIYNKAMDWHRRNKDTPGGESDWIDVLGDDPEEAPSAEKADALYALGFLHHTLQEMRHHCESTGKMEIWRIFEDLVLAQGMPNRDQLKREALLKKFPGESWGSIQKRIDSERRKEVLKKFPGKDLKFIEARILSAHRMFDRILIRLIPEGLTENRTDKDRLKEWKEILRTSSFSQLGQLYLACCVSPVPGEESVAIPSLAVVGGGPPTAPPGDGVLPAVSDEDVLKILLSFRLRLPFATYLRRGSATTDRARGAPQPPASLLELIDSPPPEPGSQRRDDELELLERLKELAKQIMARSDHDLPPEIAKLLYVLSLALAVTRCESRINSRLSDQQFAENFDLAWRLPWLVDSLRPVFLRGLQRLASGPGPA